VTRENLDDYFPPGKPLNVSLLTGEREVVVDLDCAEAVLAAQLVLPATGCKAGRKSRPCSHWHYVITDDPPNKARDSFCDPLLPPDSKNKIAEILSTGACALSPPSKHDKVDEVYVWYADGPAGRVLCAGLRAAVGRLSAAALLGRYWPKGSRHDAALALAGWLLGAGWSVEDAERFVEAVCAAAQDDEAQNRVEAVRDTREKLDAGENVTGWTRLGELLGDRGAVIARRAREWLSIKTGRPATAKPFIRELPPYQPFPVEALPEPMREFVRQGTAAKRCDPAYVALPALAVSAGLIGYTRVLQLRRDWRAPSVLWAMIVADSGSLKSPAANLTTDYLFVLQNGLDLTYQQELKAHEAAGEESRPPVRQTVFTSDATIEAMAELLDDNRRGVIVACDEMNAWFGSFTRYKGSGGGSDLPRWMSMHSAGGLVLHRRTGHRRYICVPHAAVSIAGGIQPKILARVMSDEFLAAGLAARLLMAMPPRPVKVWTDAEIAEETERRYYKLLTALHALSFKSGSPDYTPHVLTLAPDAKARWIEWYNGWGLKQAAAAGEQASAYAKLEEAAACFAMLHHVVTLTGLELEGKNDADFSVGLQSIEAGIALTHWFADEGDRIYSILSESPDQCEARKLVEFIRSHGGRITARALQNSNSRKYPNAETAEAALSALVTAGVGHWEEGPAPAHGGHRPRWLALRPTSDTSYTRPEDDDGDDGGTSDTRPDTRPPTPENPGENGQVSEVSDVGRRYSSPEEPKQPSAPETKCRKQVSDAPLFVPAPEGARGRKKSELSPYVLVRDDTDLPPVATAIAESTLVGLDCETIGLNPRTGRVRLLSLCCDTCDGGTVTYIVDCFAVDPAALWPALADVPIVAHNASFDLAFLAGLGFSPGQCFDTMLESQALYAGDRRVKHNLAACCERELGETVSKEEQRSDWSGALTAEQLRYAALDAVLTRRLHDALTPKLAEAELTETAAIEHAALPALAWLSAAGVGFDTDAWLTLATEAAAEAERLSGELDRLAPPPSQPELFGSGWKWTRPKHVAAALAAVGHPVEHADDNTLAAIDHPLAALLRDYRAAKKRAGTYGPHWLKGSYAGGRIYAGWRQMGAAPGRMTCSRPNLQNLPRDARYRRCIVAPPGRVLVKADFSQIELRLAAKIAGDKRMIAAFRQGDDLHTVTARTILGKARVSKADRQLAKAVNFGLLYGMGARAFRLHARSTFGVELTEAEAEQYRRAFFRAYPGLARWHARAERTEYRPLDTRTLTGRRRLRVIRFTEKLNTPVQGSGADGLKAALGLLWERRGECPGALPVLAVHDEIVVECDADQAEAVAAWLKRAMLDGMAPLADPVPVAVEVAVARTWGGDGLS
jgi:DNA polymerase I-like protein with 3'-5' exonuclease and polymerase domains